METMRRSSMEVMRPSWSSTRRWRRSVPRCMSRVWRSSSTSPAPAPNHGAGRASATLVGPPRNDRGSQLGRFTRLSWSMRVPAISVVRRL